jgi:hypothetical protein
VVVLAFASCCCRCLRVVQLLDHRAQTLSRDEQAVALRVLDLSRNGVGGEGGTVVVHAANRSVAVALHASFHLLRPRNVPQLPAALRHRGMGRGMLCRVPCFFGGTIC